MAENANGTGLHTVLPANRFQLVFTQYVLGFARASGLEDSVDYDIYAEGGVNDFPWVWAKPSQQPHILTLERGAQLRPLFGKKVTLLPGTEIEGGIVVKILDVDGKKALRSFQCENAMVVKWELSQLDASSNEVLIERIEIAHSGFREIKV